MNNPHPFPVPKIGVWLDPAYPQAAVPVRNHEFDYGWDVVCAEDTFVPNNARVIIQTGVVFEFPPGWGCWITDRSSTFLKRGLHVHLGKIDCRWREAPGIAVQCMVGAQTHVRYENDQTISTYDEHIAGTRAEALTFGQLVKAGERIGQLVFMPVFEVELTRLDQRPESVRGGWGSSGT